MARSLDKTLTTLMAVSSPAADTCRPNPLRRNVGLDGPVGSGATRGPEAGADAIEGPGINGAGLPVGACPPGADQQALADC